MIGFQGPPAVGHLHFAWVAGESCDAQAIQPHEKLNAVKFETATDYGGCGWGRAVVPMGTLDTAVVSANPLIV